MTSRRGLAALASVSALILVACAGSDDAVDTVPDDAAPDESVAASSTSSSTVLVAAPGTDPIATDGAPVEPEPTEPGSTEPEGTEPSSADPIATEAPADNTAPAPAPAPDPGSGEGGSDDGDGEEPGDGSCLRGDWVITNEELNEYYGALAANSGPDVDFAVIGDATMSFFDDTFLYVAGFDLDFDIGGQTATGTAAGSINGDYSASDGIITTSNEAGGADISVTVAGVTIDGSDLGNDLLDSFPINSAPFSCDGPTIMFQSGPSPDQRHPVELTPIE